MRALKIGEDIDYDSLAALFAPLMSGVAFKWGRRAGKSKAKAKKTKRSTKKAPKRTSRKRVDHRRPPTSATT
mgnify:CR=1 FL=1